MVSILFRKSSLLFLRLSLFIIKMCKFCRQLGTVLHLVLLRWFRQVPLFLASLFSCVFLSLIFPEDVSFTLISATLSNLWIPHPYLFFLRMGECRFFHNHWWQRDRLQKCAPRERSHSLSLSTWIPSYLMHILFSCNTLLSLDRSDWADPPFAWYSLKLAILLLGSWCWLTFYLWTYVWPDLPNACSSLLESTWGEILHYSSQLNSDMQCVCCVWK